MKRKKVTVVGKKRIFDDFFKIDEAKLRFEQFDGKMSTVIRRLNFERGDAAAALIFNTETQRYLLTKQFRYPSYTKEHGWLLEVVAGVIDKDETPEQAVKREVLEEIGFKLDKMEEVTSFFTTPGGSSERIFLFYAEVTNANKTVKGGGVKDEHEDIQLVEYSIEQIEDLFNSHAFLDAKTLVAIQWILLKKLTKKNLK